MPSAILPPPDVLVLTGLGLLIALVAWLPLALRRRPLSLPVVCIGIGAVLFALPGVSSRPLPTEYPSVTEHLAEFVIIVALMGAGLKIERVFHLRRWAVTWRLLAVTMPLTILAITGLSLLAGLPLAAALLLGATLSSTDPSMAAEVQLPPPLQEPEDEVRFGLTSEAGLNDGLIFPFVNLAILLVLAAETGEPFWAEWIGYHLAWKVAAGLGLGWAVGWGFGWLTFRLPLDRQLAQTGDGLVAIGASLVAYGVAEAAHGYGFCAVFVAALALRHAHRRHAFHRDMHEVTEQVERLAMMALLVLFGGALASGLLAPLSWPDVALALAILLLVRPLAGALGLVGLRLARREKLVLAVYGIHGVGSFFYLAHAVNAVDFPQVERLWAVAGLVVLLSVLGHGLSVQPAMRWLDRKQGRDPDAPERPMPPGA
ncbi:cation:proton antiporter [Falsiroseomonas selenitidurans]|uniref:Sodium:proton antiporter n=1 Tax=Falsiroseomonas selenitidurans TaxID=2716335 RepID=A0ABX1E2T0_9PROT|nr:cation:proton antiporter [Falsiroseomonas selenitidurans]NKC31475.1 sodium:proton antiporter [Falsiroseomonas selenitidurans]